MNAKINEREGRNKSSIKKRKTAYQEARNKMAKILSTKRENGIQAKILNILKKGGFDKEKSAKMNYRLEKIFSEEGLNKKEYIEIRELPDKDLQNFKNLIDNRVSYYRNIAKKMSPTITEENYRIKTIKSLISKGTKAYEEINSTKTGTVTNHMTAENKKMTEERNVEINVQRKTNEANYSRDYIISTMKSLNYESSIKEIDIANINNGINIPEVRLLVSKGCITILLHDEQVGVIYVDDKGNYKKLNYSKYELSETFSLLNNIRYFKELQDQYEDSIQRKFIKPLETNLGSDIKDLINYEDNRPNYGFQRKDKKYNLDVYKQREKKEDEINKKVAKIKELFQNLTKELTHEEKFSIFDRLIKKYIRKPRYALVLYYGYFYDLEFVKRTINGRKIKNYQNRSEQSSTEDKAKKRYHKYLIHNHITGEHLSLDRINRCIMTNSRLKIKEYLKIIINKKNKMERNDILETIQNMYDYQINLSTILNTKEWKENVNNMTNEYISLFSENERRKIADYLIKNGFGYYVYITSELFGYNKTEDTEQSNLKKQ